MNLLLPQEPGKFPLREIQRFKRVAELAGISSE
jgi:hypothetical protein